MCAVCSLVINPADLEYEIEHVADLYAHQHCFTLWREEAANLVECCGYVTAMQLRFIKRAGSRLHVWPPTGNGPDELRDTPRFREGASFRRLALLVFSAGRL